jgi:uncharacterized SAM-binding protein YcdF (DUF218 family)
MIARASALFLLLYALGFVFFAFTLGRPAKAETRTDALVVLTGGPGRIEHGIKLLSVRRAKRMLIAGADPSVTKGDIIRRIGGRERLIDCCVDLGSESVDTRSNAEEAERWLTRRGYKTVRVVTNDYHMRRTRYEFTRTLGGRFDVVYDAVRTEVRFPTLFGEYNDYVLRRLAVWADL